MGKIFYQKYKKMPGGTYKDNQYKKIKLLGRGAFGSINLCENTKQADSACPDKFVAMKKITIINAGDNKETVLQRELKILREYSHPNIVKLYDTFTQCKDTFLVLEYLTFDLGAYIDKSGTKLGPNDIKYIFRETLLGLKYLHENFILHRDMKTQNIMLGCDGKVKLIDFGCAKGYGNPEQPMTLQISTRWYKPPEVMFGDKSYGASFDVWSCGCILAEMFLGKAIFMGGTDIDMLGKIFEIRGSPNNENWPDANKLPYFMEFEHIKPVALKNLMPDAPEEAIDLMEQMLQLNPSYRPSLEKALAHPWFTSVVQKGDLKYLAYLKKIDYVLNNNMMACE